MAKGLQYQRTDRCIVDAFVALVNECGFEKLTVQQILDRAMVSKNTFYVHYRDKYDIAEQLFGHTKEAFRTFLTEHGESARQLVLQEETPDDTLSPAATRQFFADKSEIMSCLMKIKTDKVDMTRFISEVFRERYLRVEPDDGRGAEAIALEAEIYAGIYGCLSRFFAGSDLQPQQEMIDKALCRAFLRAYRVIEPGAQEEAIRTLERLQQQAAFLPENYNN